MSADDQTLSPAKPEDVVNSLAFALRYSGRKRVNDAGEMMAAMVAKRLVEHLRMSGYVVMQRPPAGGAAPLGSAGGPRDPAKVP